MDKQNKRHIHIQPQYAQITPLSPWQCYPPTFLAWKVYVHGAWLYVASLYYSTYISSHLWYM